MRQPAPFVFPPAAPCTLSRAAVEVEYPSSDGKPLAENDPQLAAILYGVGALRVHYAGRGDVYVSGDLLVYYREGNPRVSVAPDVLVVFGVEDRERMSYRVWEEGKGPDFVLEVASPSTWRADVGRKRVVYEELGVKEYCLYDPTGKYLKPALRGYRLVGGEYERQPSVESLDGRRSLYSETLGLDLWAKGRKMRFRDPETGLDLLSYDEEHDRAEREAAACRNAEGRAEQEAAARQQEAAARRNAETRAEREATARRSAEVRAEQEAAARRNAETRAEREAAARQEEAAARQAAEARVAELEALLDAKRG